MSKLAVNANPCASCPYRRDCPSGLWHPKEYEKLPLYDTNAKVSVFLCHQTPAIGVETVCRGWLTVHAESVAARIATIRGQVTDAERYAVPSVPLYASGMEAAKAGLRGVRRPGVRARKMIDRLTKKIAALGGEGEGK